MIVISLLAHPPATCDILPEERGSHVTVGAAVALLVSPAAPLFVDALCVVASGAGDGVHVPDPVQVLLSEAGDERDLVIEVLQNRFIVAQIPRRLERIDVAQLDIVLQHCRHSVQDVPADQ